MGVLSRFFQQPPAWHALLWHTMEFMASHAVTLPDQASEMPCYHTYYAAVPITQRHVKG
jgi:hypothetical protein